MKKSLRILSLLLALVFALSLAPLSAFAFDDPNEGQIAEIPAGETLNVNADSGEIGTNNGTVTTNNGEIGINAAGATVTTNNGTVTNNNGTVTTNAAPPPGEYVGGVIETNAGTVGDRANPEDDNQGNAGVIVFNEGTVTVNTTDANIIQNEGTVLYNYGEVSENAAGGVVECNINEISYNDGTVNANVGFVAYNGPDGKVYFNTGTVDVNLGTVANACYVAFNFGTVDNDSNSEVRYNAGGTVVGGTVDNNGWGLIVDNGKNINITGNGVVQPDDCDDLAFIPETNSGVEVSVAKQDGYTLSVDAGGTGFTTAAEGGSWKVSFGAVLNNLRIIISKLAAPAAPAGIVEDRSGLNEQYLSFIYAVVEKIGQAPENGTVEIDAGAWRSFRREVFQALALRPDVTLKVTYKGADGLMRLTVPAGTDVLGLLGGKAVIEFADLAALLAVAPVEADMKLTPRG